MHLSISLNNSTLQELQNNITFLTCIMDYLSIRTLLCLYSKNGVTGKGRSAPSAPIPYANTFTTSACMTLYVQHCLILHRRIVQLHCLCLHHKYRLKHGFRVASVPGLPRSVRVLIMRRRQTFENRGRPGLKYHVR